MPQAQSGWFALLVGHQWPGLAALTATGSASANRRSTGVNHEQYAELVQSIRSSQLSAQSGTTAQDIDSSYSSGEFHAREISERNRIKAGAHSAAHQYTSQLRSDLEAIAESGESAIRAIVHSDAPVAEKISAIASVVLDAQGQANCKAAQQASNVLDALQDVLNAEGIGVSARQFARQQGVDLDSAFRPQSQDRIETHVASVLDKLPESTAVPTTENPAGDEAIEGTPAWTALDQLTGDRPTGSDGPATRPSISDLVTVGIGRDVEYVSDGGPANAQPENLSGPTLLPTAPGTQFSASEAVGSDHIPTSAAAATTAATTVPPVLAASASAPVPNTVGPPTPTVRQGSLQAYGASIRPPAPTAAPAVPMTPAGAPVSPANPAAAISQPAVVRHHRTAATPGAVAAGTTERAFAAAATGAAAEQTRPRTAAENRLRRLLDAVARQQPRLRWAISDLEDATTVLVTDLADGWVPPRIDIPSGVRLPQPGAQAIASLGNTTLTAAYEPGRQLSPEGEPIPMSIRARDTAPVDDLGWELAQATRWRDGLPRLAHTLAKAASANTGWPDSEVQLLRAHLDALACSVLERYPGNVNPIEIGNWQLLATIDALMNGEKTSANYHFAWFRVQALAGQGFR